MNFTCQSIISHAISNLTGHSLVFSLLLPNFFGLIFPFTNISEYLPSVKSLVESQVFFFHAKLKIWINYRSSLSIIGNKNVCVLKIKSDALVKRKLIYHMRIFKVLLIFQIKRLQSVCALPTSSRTNKISCAITFQNNFTTSAVIYRSDWKAHLEKRHRFLCGFK